jgi:glycosyltransferase involved in cell wall biosynthesis
MISILIPVYNRNVVSLVTSLQSQLIAVKEKGEIVVMDDGSSDQLIKNTNQINLSSLEFVRYIELPINTGRNIIRHNLAKAANYDTLIFLDADSSFPNEKWLQNYLAAISGNAIIMGGRIYKTEKPASSTLHFRYGKHREENDVYGRNRFPYRSFLACNFLITKKQFSLLIIDNHLRGYCHEDTFMGLQFEKLGMVVKHINNPVYHQGIDEDNVFMEKQQEALENLQYLYHSYYNSYNFNGGIKLIRVYRDITGIELGKYILNKMVKWEAVFKNNTLKSHRLVWLDLWKLVVFHKLYSAPAI